MNSPRKFIEGALLVSLILFAAALVVLPLAGCGRDQRVIDGMDTRDKAVQLYAANMDAILQSVLNSYKAGEYERIDGYHQLDLEKLDRTKDANGRIDSAKALKFLADADLIRNQKRADVDKQIADTLATYEQAKKDLVVATKLNQVLRAYEEAGVEVSSVQKAVDQIMSILRPSTPKPAAPPLPNAGEPRGFQL